MKFVEMTGKSLAEIVTGEELYADDLASAGIKDESIVRVNEQGDIEVRRPDGWDIIGGLIGEYKERIRRLTGMDWA